MHKNHDILTYAKLAEGARFFLDESFKYVNEALRYEAASKIFSRLINEIEPTEKDNKIVNEALIPDSPIQLLQSEELNILSDETISKFRTAWDKANLLARIEKTVFNAYHKVISMSYQVSDLLMKIYLYQPQEFLIGNYGLIQIDNRDKYPKANDHLY